jgi:hypothetical protein
MRTAITQQLIDALSAALRALNTARRFKVGDTDSYAIAAQAGRALKAAENPTSKALRDCYAVISQVAEAMQYEGDDAVTALDGSQIQRMYDDLCHVRDNAIVAIAFEDANQQ